jgi:tetratricopeptide (TPR) repeat protein
MMISPEAQKERTIDTLNRIVLKGAQLRPLVLAIEDLHWMDASSNEAVAQILDNIPAEKVLVVLTYRPQFTPGWATKSYHCPIMLSRLSDRECLAIARHLLQSDTIDKEVSEMVVEKTEGVPFFVEELIRSLITLGIIQKKEGHYRLNLDKNGLHIPSTIQDIIMSRVDALPESAREILKTGSAIEREFSYALIKKVTGLPSEELAAGFSLLRQAELIYQRGLIPEATYIFKHSLTMEALYSSILTHQKQQLHQRIGQALEEIYANSTDEQSALLTRHFMEAGDYTRAAKYAKVAARRAHKSNSYESAITFTKTLVTAIGQMPAMEYAETALIDARTALARYCMSLNRHTEAKQAVDPIVDQAIALDYKKRLPVIFVAIGSHCHFLEDHDQALAYLNKAIEIAQQTSDWWSLWHGNYHLAVNYWLTADFESSSKCFQTCLDLSRMGQILTAMVFIKGTISTNVLISQGRISSAYALSEEALQTAEKCADVHTRGMAYSAHGVVCFFMGDFERALRFVSEAIDLCHKSGHAIWKGQSEQFLGNIYYFDRKYVEAQKYFINSVSTYEKNDIWPSWKIIGRLSLQMAIAADSGVIDPSFSPTEYRQKNKLPIIEGLVNSIIARILIMSDPSRLPEAEQLLIDAIAADERNGTRWYLAQDYAVLAELYRKKEDTPSAKLYFNHAIEIMRECGADGWVSRYEQELAALC